MIIIQNGGTKMNNLKYLAAFSAGVIAGAVVSWKIFERRFEPVDGEIGRAHV